MNRLHYCFVFIVAASGAPAQDGLNLVSPQFNEFSVEEFRSTFGLSDTLGELNRLQNYRPLSPADISAIDNFFIRNNIILVYPPNDLGFLKVQPQNQVSPWVDPSIQINNGVPKLIETEPFIARERPTLTSSSTEDADFLINFLPSKTPSREKLGCYAQISGELGPKCDPFLKAGTPGSCLPFSPTEFTEVVALETVFSSGKRDQCTGTLVANNWVLTAAHCVMEEKSSDLLDFDTAGPGPELDLSQIEMTISLKYPGVSKSYEFKNSPRRIVAHKNYVKPEGDVGQSDLALIELKEAFPSGTFDIALIGDRIDEKATIVGFGYTETAQLGQMNLGWPPALERVDQTRLRSSTDPSKSLFCMGDSGGPAFIGYNRGCDGQSISPEQRPRSQQGVISSFSASTDQSTDIRKCQTSTSMHIEDVTGEAVREWLCQATNNALPHCGVLGFTVPNPTSGLDCSGETPADCFLSLGAVKIDHSGLADR